VGVALSLVTITRGATWIASNVTEKSQEVKDFTYLKDKKERQPSPYAIYISRTQKCCGVNSFHDWIEIYKEVDDADKATASITRPRKLPDFCCNEKKSLTHGCGNRAIDSLRETLRDAKSNCTDFNKDDSRKRCLEYYNSLNLKDPVKSEGYDEEKKALEEAMDTSISGNNIRLVWVKDSRIKPGKDRESLKSLSAVQAIIKDSCKKETDPKKTKNKNYPQEEKSKQAIFLLYGGKVKRYSGTNNSYVFIDNDNPKDRLVPCDPEEMASTSCFHKIIPLVHFENEYSFCQWLTAKVTASGLEEIKLDGEIAAGIVEKDGRIYTKGCGTFVIKYIDNFVICSFGLSILLLILYFVDMITFTHYYLAYV